jgi:hypothetical protein
MPMNTQTRIIVGTAFALAAVDIAVRGLALRQQAPVVTNNNIVTAREFRLVDNNGKIKATMSTDREGNPGILLFDQSGNRRLQIDSYQDVPSLMLFGPQGERRAYYGMNADGSSLVQMLDENQNVSAEMNMNYSNGAFQFQDRSGQVTTRYSVNIND